MPRALAIVFKAKLFYGIRHAVKHAPAALPVKIIAQSQHRDAVPRAVIIVFSIEGNRRRGIVDANQAGERECGNCAKPK